MRVTFPKARRGFTIMIARDESAHVEQFAAALTLSLTTMPIFAVLSTGDARNSDHNWDILSIFADRFGVRAVYDFKRHGIANWQFQRKAA